MMIDPVLATGMQTAAAIVILLGALAKWRRLAAFRHAIDGYRLLPDGLIAPAAFAIAVTETLGTAAMLFPATRTMAASVLIALLFSFASGLAINIARGRTDIDCGCSGFGAPQVSPPRGIGWFHVARVLLLAALVATAFIESSARQIVWLDYLTLFFSVLLIVCALFIVDALTNNAPRLSRLRNS